MAQRYITKQGEMLDGICWQHYGQRRQLEQAAREIDAVAADFNENLRLGIDALSQASPRNLSGMVERVLAVNPGLAAMGPVLPAGIAITLPDYSQAVDEAQVVQLWDD